MKIINKPVKVLAIFEKNGSIIPVKFEYEDNFIRIHKVMKSYEQKIFGKTNIFFVCLQNGKDLYELKYVIEDYIWYIYKM